MADSALYSRRQDPFGHSHRLYGWASSVSCDSGQLRHRLKTQHRVYLEHRDVQEVVADEQRALKWHIPWYRVKRWLVLAALGLILMALGSCSGGGSF